MTGVNHQFNKGRECQNILSLLDRRIQIGLALILVVLLMAVTLPSNTLAQLIFPTDGVVTLGADRSVQIQSSPLVVSDGQFVWGPNVGAFSIQAFLQTIQSPLLPYAVELESWARYSTVNPRVLLAVLESNYGSVTGLDPSIDPESVRGMIEQTAMDLSLAFYQHLYSFGERSKGGPPLLAKGVQTFSFEDGVQADLLWSPSSGSYAISAIDAKSQLLAETFSSQSLGGASSFETIWGYFFPDTDPLDTSNNLEPGSPPPDETFQFPFPLDATWTFSGAHSWSGGSSYPDRSSMDFNTPWSNYPNAPYKNTVAAAAGDAVVRVPYTGRAPCWVEIDHGGGWKTHYYHLVNLGASGPVGPMSRNQLIGGIGQEVCNGGFATGPHVHFALFYNGAPYDLDGLKLSGWTVHEGPRDSNAYNTGYLERDGVTVSPWNWITNDYETYFNTGGDYSLYFQGNTSSEVDRVKIPIDDPARTNPGPIMDLGFYDFVLEWWMKANPGDNTAPIVTCGANTDWKAGNILFDRSRSTGGTQWGVSIANGRVVFGVTNSSNQSRTLCSNTIVDDGAWHHVAIQRNRWDSSTGAYADGQLWLFIDGVLEATAVGPIGDISYPDGAAPGSTCGPTGNLTCKDDSYLVVGGGKNGTGRPFRGWIDDIRGSAWLRYLTNFNPPTAPHARDSLTIALYRLDSGTGNVAYDTGGYDGGTSNGWLYLGGSPTGPMRSADTPFNPYPPFFTDVLPDHWAYDYIQSLAVNGIAAGYVDGTYRPENDVTRAEMAVFLLRGMYGISYAPPSVSSPPTFNDISSHWSWPWIEQLYDEGLTSGFQDGSYRPANPVSRAEAAVFLLKAKFGSGYTPPPASATPVFNDIDGHWAEAWIEASSNAGITSGYPDGSFRPANPVNRAEMAVFLVAAFGLPIN
jgi:murein DD-endopeptidase MepM/ murein hydrolase activator NlpD